MLIIPFVSSAIQQRVVNGSESTCVNLMLKMPQSRTSFIQTIPSENQALHPCDQGRFSPDMLLQPWVFEAEGRKD